MEDVRPVHIPPQTDEFGRDISQDFIVGHIAPNIEYDEKLGHYIAKAFLIEEGTNKVAAGWEYARPIRTKRNAKRMAKKIALHMAAKLNRSAKEPSEKEEK